MVNKWPFEEIGQNARKGNYYSFAFSDNMPKLNTNNKELRDYFLDICEMWVREYDVDGLRLDVANEVSHKFCKELRSRMKEIKDDFYILLLVLLFWYMLMVLLCILFQIVFSLWGNR